MLHVASINVVRRQLHSSKNYRIHEMAKGRRERDKPKAPPGALYNPNKRVKLSYDTDSEEEADAGAEQIVVNGSGKDAYQEADTDVLKESVDAATQEPEDVVEETQSGPQEASEEPTDSAETEQKPAKRKPRTQRRNRHTGQWNALGAEAWEQEGDEDEKDGSPDEAMEYLRAVRSERQAMPAVLSSLHADAHDGQYDMGWSDFGNDHAFVAAPEHPLQRQDVSRDPREAFTEVLKERFHDLRHQLHQTPSPEAVTALDYDHPIYYPHENEAATRSWLKILESTPPALAQVRSLDQDDVIRILELIQDCFVEREMDINPITSAWIWSLFARLDEVGMMNNDQVYAVRALGKKAVLVLVSLRSADTAAQLARLSHPEDEPQDEDPTTSSIKLDLAENAENTVDVVDQDQTLPAEKAADRENTLATLDSVLVIAGDVYGQRDLLEFRRPWETIKDEKGK